MKYSNHKYQGHRLFSPQCKGLTPVETVHENPWFIVRNRGGYFTTEYCRAQVVVMPIVESCFILMVWAKRPVLADIHLELPGGSVEDNESPVQAVYR
jgi:hypothetical protein